MIYNKDKNKNDREEKIDNNDEESLIDDIEELRLGKQVSRVKQKIFTIFYYEKYQTDDDDHNNSDEIDQIG